MSKHPDAAFGNDTPLSPPPPKTITYEEVADFFRKLENRALTTTDASDTLQLLEYMHDHCVSLFDAQREHEKSLVDREIFLTKREAEIALKQRAVEAVLRLAPSTPKKRYFWS